jgi:hypothetical protein
MALLYRTPPIALPTRTEEAIDQPRASAGMHKALA